MLAEQTTFYEIRDVNSTLVAIHKHVRPGRTSEKDCYWQQPDGSWGLNGLRVEDLPLYGVDKLDDEATLVVMTEGEKARDALADALDGARVNVLGTVCGASVTPSREVLEVLRGQEVVLWPDADEPGREHMRRVAEQLHEVAVLVRVFDWPEAKEKGDDAADHPAVQSKDEKCLDRLLNDLCGAPAYVPAGPGTSGTGPSPQPITATELMALEFEPTCWVVPDVLPEGLSLLAGKPKKGKS